jgi:hypothetical protein
VPYTRYRDRRPPDELRGGVIMAWIEIGGAFCQLDRRVWRGGGEMIDFISGGIEVLASFPGSQHAHDLATLPDGRVALTGWELGGATYAVVVLDANETLLAIQSQSFEAQMVGMLRASSEGISFVASDSAAGWSPSGARFEVMEWNEDPSDLQSLETVFW